MFPFYGVGEIVGVKVLVPTLIYINRTSPNTYPDAVYIFQALE